MFRLVVTPSSAWLGHASCYLALALCSVQMKIMKGLRHHWRQCGFQNVNDDIDSQIFNG